MRSVRQILLAIKNPEAPPAASLEKTVQLAKAFGAKLELFHTLSKPLYASSYDYSGVHLKQLEDELRARCLFESLKEGALTMQQGGGVGYDFSTLRPRGSSARTSGMVASGPVSFMRVWDAMCATILSTGARRGAMMATLRCDHPDIEEFIDAKRSPDALRHFNLSVLVTNAFMDAVARDGPWPLVFPTVHEHRSSGETVDRAWSGNTAAVPCLVYKTVRARELWKRLCESAFDCAEPGVLFIDRINNSNNLEYLETLSATNPCGEEPLPPCATHDARPPGAERGAIRGRGGSASRTESLLAGFDSSSSQRVSPCGDDELYERIRADST